MDFIQEFSNYGLVTVLLLAVLSFIGGFIDAVVGGGGLIVIPGLLINFPNAPLATLFGTNKIAALSGTRRIALSVLPCQRFLPVVRACPAACTCHQPIKPQLVTTR